MNEQQQYSPSPAGGVEVRKDNDEKWTLILVRQLRHSPEKVWNALTDPAELSEWAPFNADGNLGTAGATVKLQFMGAPAPFDATVTRADAPKVLEYGDMKWELEGTGGGTKLTLWHSIDRRFIAWGTAGWHICLDVLDQKLSGNPVARIAGPDAMKIEGWQRLTGEYAQLLGVELPKWGR